MKKKKRKIYTQKENGWAEISYSQTKASLISMGVETEQRGNYKFWKN